LDNTILGNCIERKENFIDNFTEVDGTSIAFQESLEQLVLASPKKSILLAPQEE